MRSHASQVLLSVGICDAKVLEPVCIYYLVHSIHEVPDAVVMPCRRVLSADVGDDADTLHEETVFELAGNDKVRQHTPCSMHMNSLPPSRQHLPCHMMQSVLPFKIQGAYSYMPAQLAFRRGCSPTFSKF
jgi:hypothetical protein